MDVGNLIKINREKRGLSMQDLAILVGVSKQSIYNYEHSLRKPKIQVGIKICDILGIEFDSFKKAFYPEINKKELYSEIEIIRKQQDIRNKYYEKINALEHQIEKYIEEDKRKYVRSINVTLNALNYELAIYKNKVEIKQMYKDEIIEVDLKRFITTATLCHYMNEGLLNTLSAVGYTKEEMEKMKKQNSISKSYL